MTDLRIGVIGYGNRGEIAREAHRPGRGAAVVGICDRDDGARARAREDFADALVTGSFDELLSLGLDAVMVLTPDDRHADVAIPALEAGVAVFCEKPLATSIEDCDRILEAARRTGSRLYVGHNMRHMPVITLMRRLILEGRIGEVKAVWCRHFVGNGGDYYFKDWHADRSKSLGLLLQKGAHDIDVIHWLAGGYSSRVQAMGALAVYGALTDRRDRSGERMQDWFSLENWPPSSAEGLNPVIDVEDISQVNLALDNGALASYQQCHFTPDYWRNYTVIGSEGRIENFGDTAGSEVRLWNRRHEGAAPADETFIVDGGIEGHGGADALMISEFLDFVRDGEDTLTSPVAARNAVAAGVTATASLRGDGRTLPVPALNDDLMSYFASGQRPR
ncbi:Gfo/Idh/MocA family oxidoreductase [Leifsonia sp. 1010]|uniref:Gfo/Idh/MocA family protein n=1 Tax=Leifsonia sp. 1010 TaxID=2817769 RepID=UPI00285D4AD8|nr:Gfo/Idh/MocA family oxidoreductase [Leifsonia sp. 1010]MDR6611252.1 putative dehydrogenase [Leifsonia sp. 1010]